jgi:hypothetical protein
MVSRLRDVAPMTYLPVGSNKGLFGCLHGCSHVRDGVRPLRVVQYPPLEIRRYFETLH